MPYLRSAIRRPMAPLSILAMLLTSSSASAQDDGYVLYLSEYLYGDFYVAELGDVDSRRPRRIRPRLLRLPASFRANAELGNADVSFAGRRIVFGARNTSDFDWGIFIGSIDLAGERITQVEPLIQNDGVREEDPRFSWDGAHIVYKCDGDICIYPDDYGNPVVSSACELWAPAFDASKTLITYAKRCDGSLSDRIWQYSLVDRTERQVPNAGGGPDRFSHFLGDGRIVYSHIDSGSATASLWIYEPASGVTGLLHDRTDSDDDPYPDKHDGNHLAFIGWKGNGYDLYMYRESTRDSVQLTRGVSVLGPVLFR